MRLIAGWMVCGLLAAAPVMAAEIPLADFARHEQFRAVKISPDGEYIAVSGSADGHSTLVIMHLADRKSVVLRPRGDDEVADFWWVGPQRVLYSVATRVGSLETPVLTGELFAANADGGSHEMLFGIRAGDANGETASHIKQRKAERASARLIDDHAVDNEVLISVQPWNLSQVAGASGGDTAFMEVRRMDVRSGRTRPVCTSPLRYADFLADRSGRVRFAWGTDAANMEKVYYRAPDGHDWELVFDEAKDGHRVAPLAFNRAGDKVWFDCPGAKGVGGACTFEPATKTWTTVWSGDEAGLSGVDVTFDDRDLFALRSMPGRTSVHLLDKEAPESRLLVAMMQQFVGDDVRFVSHSADGKRVVVEVSGDVNPGEFFLYDATAKKTGKLVDRRPWLNPDLLAPTEPVAFESRDGLKLHGYLTRPPGKDKETNLPLVVAVHGGPYDVRDTWSFDPDVQAIASRGYAVLQVNYRGSGGYGDKFVSAGYREWGGAMQDDVTDATRWAIAQKIADPKRVCIYGASYGGYAALQGAVKEPDLYACAVGYVGVYDLRLMHSRGDVPQTTRGENYLKTVLGDDEEELWRRSPLAGLDRLKAQVMLVVGGQDRRVPPIQGERLHAALDERKIAHEWLYQRNEGHGFYAAENRADLLTKLVAFLDRNIGAKAQAAGGP